MSNLDDLMREDPIANIEEQTDKHHSEFNKGEEMLALMEAMSVGEKKKQALKAENDTYMSMGWQEFIDIIKNVGFKGGNVYDYHYCRPDWDEHKIEAAGIFYHPDKHLVIWAESYNGKSTVNSGKLVGYIQAPKGDIKPLCKALRRCSREGFSSGDTFWFDYDIRQGLKHKINQIEEAGGIFVNNWPGDKSLWFLDLAEWQVYEEIDNWDAQLNFRQEVLESKINNSTQELKEMYWGDDNDKV